MSGALRVKTNLQKPFLVLAAAIICHRVHHLYLPLAIVQVIKLPKLSAGFIKNSISASQTRAHVNELMRTTKYRSSVVF